MLACASGRNLAFAPALLDGSAPPGEAGVTVISGHRDKHFRALATLTVGDELELGLERPEGVCSATPSRALHLIDSRRGAGIGSR